MKKLYCLIVMMASFGGFAQTNSVNQKLLDSMSQKAIYYLQQKQTDSIYSMSGESFRNNISSGDFKSIMETQVYPLNDFKNVVFVKAVNAINKYKVNGSPELQLLIGLDKDNKLETFLFQPYSDD